jgi:8-oxo-dGTP diphosphatase
MDAWYSDPRWISAPRHIVSAAVVATNTQGDVLLVRSPWRGWEMPGGQVELGESLEDAAIREVKEETGIDVAHLQFCGVSQARDRSVVNFLFYGTCVGGALQSSTESIEVGFFQPSSALEMVKHANFRERIELCLDSSRRPFLLVRP